MNKNPYLSIIIPAYNEAERLPATLLDIDKKMSGKDYAYEIIVVNDGSKDNTAEVVRKMTPAVKNLRLVDNAANKGKGGVVRQGMLLATGDIRLFMDADNSTKIDDFEKMRPLFADGYDVVIGSRAVKGAVQDPPEPWYRQLPGKMGNLYIQILILPGIWDTQCGFKAFTAEAAEKVFNLSRITGWGFDVEALALANRFHYRMGEVPVYWVHDTRSHIGMSAYLKVLLEVAKIRWALWTNKYRLS
ncbi:MAG TPA: dolichyl-phosphate beta-glucosyltransferase [Candidatus Paceibacterota bacterium]|nr:dolichyl-phosphate beta-glucosyltransferase [Candidatus Paceibacterota bacterium]HVN66769.1 dolichyl-phosphate beta-glucosyltransferase [Candidatus Sulfotelmatobacter sp.]